MVVGNRGDRARPGVTGRSITTSTSTTRSKLLRGAASSELHRRLGPRPPSQPTCRSGAYVSGGFDSGVVAALAARLASKARSCWASYGRFLVRPGVRREPSTPRTIAQRTAASSCSCLDMGVDDFVDNIRKVIYHLDYPVAGPGSFPQYMISAELASQPSQGGPRRPGRRRDLRRLHPLPRSRTSRQCIKAAIEGTDEQRQLHRHVRVDHPEPHGSLRNATSRCSRSSGAKGCSRIHDRRYFRLIDRAPALGGRGPTGRLLGDHSPVRDVPVKIFRADNVRQGVVLRLHDALRLQDAACRRCCRSRTA